MYIRDISVESLGSVYHHLKDKCAQYSYTVSSLYGSYRVSIWKLCFLLCFSSWLLPPCKLYKNLYFSKFLYHSNLGNWNCFPRFKPPLTYDLLLLYQVSLSLHYTLSSLDITNRSRAQSANPDHSPSPLQYRLQLIVSYLVMR